MALLSTYAYGQGESRKGACNSQKRKLDVQRLVGQDRACDRKG